jgi:hypothetical protein
MFFGTSHPKFFNPIRYAIINNTAATVSYPFDPVIEYSTKLYVMHLNVWVVSWSLQLALLVFWLIRLAVFACRTCYLLSPKLDLQLQ